MNILVFFVLSHHLLFFTTLGTLSCLHDLIGASWVLTWQTYSSLISHSSLWYFLPLWHLPHQFFFLLISHITTWDIHSISFPSSLSTWHYPCFTLISGFPHIATWKGSNYLSLSPFCMYLFYYSIPLTYVISFILISVNMYHLLILLLMHLFI